MGGSLPRLPNPFTSMLSTPEPGLTVHLIYRTVALRSRGETVDSSAANSFMILENLLFAFGIVVLAIVVFVFVQILVARWNDKSARGEM